MPNADNAPLFYVWERSALFVMGRLEGLDGANLKEADITAISMLITKLPSKAVVAPPAIVVASVVFDTLQTDSRWKKDDIGYNCGHMLDGDALLTDPESQYELAYLVEPASSGEKIRRAIRVQPRQIHGLV